MTGGRVWIIWNPAMFNVQILLYDAQFIHLVAMDLESKSQFTLTMTQGPWVICGYFNTVLSPTERLGGHSTEEEIADFKQCVDECEVLDCPASGSLYTWCNKQDPTTRVYSRLDRVLVNQMWLTENSLAYAHFYCEGMFDHTPCVVQEQCDGPKKRRSFKYLNMWSQSVDFKSCVQEHWSKNWPGTKMYKLVHKLKNLKGPLKSLNRNDFDDIENNAARARMYLESIQEKLRIDPNNPELIHMEIEAVSSVRFLEDACYTFLVQKSKVTWVDKGDSNNRYFHSVIKTRQVRSKIMKIEDAKGVLCEDITQIQNAFIEFYTDLLGTSSSVTKVSQHVVQLGNLCTEDHHAILLAPITNDEIKQGAKGLRQGDPISPLLFTIAMEYLSRILAYTTATFPFKIHPLCSPLRLSHLMFADDLLLFCKGDVKSIMVILRSFSTFSHASGLQMNPTKTNSFFNGVSSDVKHEILQISGVQEGLLPFRYLGVPITCGRMSKMDCSILVEKLITRIRSFGSKKLSYSWRLVLVSSVHTALYNYWVNIFVIPKGVLNKVNSICRNYLWDGGPDFIRCPRVSWEKICSPKSEGGLGLRDSHVWNIAAMGKLVWWIYYNPGRLWVKWVNQIYLKGQCWDDYQPGNDISWGWK
ncbi:uncharacterized protein LOC141589931 [Silene latifolia]|uniref:uncharacterized protein LOC141589931 n=1 Tax=Silene latifolia TaxID=37657 RepID=UPI003D785B9C